MAKSHPQTQSQALNLRRLNLCHLYSRPNLNFLRLSPDLLVHFYLLRPLRPYHQSVFQRRKKQLVVVLSHSRLMAVVAGSLASVCTWTCQSAKSTMKEKISE